MMKMLTIHLLLHSVNALLNASEDGDVCGTFCGAGGGKSQKGRHKRIIDDPTNKRSMEKDTKKKTAALPGKFNFAAKGRFYRMTSRLAAIPNARNNDSMYGGPETALENYIWDRFGMSASRLTINSLQMGGQTREQAETSIETHLKKLMDDAYTKRNREKYGKLRTIKALLSSVGGIGKDVDDVDDKFMTTFEKQILDAKPFNNEDMEDFADDMKWKIYVSLDEIYDICGDTGRIFLDKPEMERLRESGAFTRMRRRRLHIQDRVDDTSEAASLWTWVLKCVFAFLIVGILLWTFARRNHVADDQKDAIDV